MQNNLINRHLTIETLLTAYFAAIFGSFFILDKGDQRTLMYAGAPLAIYYMIKNRRALATGFFSALILAPLGIFFLISCASILWSSPENTDMYAQTGKMIIIFPLALIPFAILCQKSPSAWGIFLASFVTAGLITAAATIPYHWHMIIAGARLESWGIASHSILGGVLYALCFLIMIFCKDKLFYYNNLSPKIFYPLAILPLCSTILTQSRGPFIALIGVFLASLVVQKKHSKDLFIKKIIPCTLVSIAAILTFCYYSRASLIERGSTGRTQIWSHALDLIKEKMVFGHGIATDFVFPFMLQGHLVEAPHVHNIYLGVFLATGAIGLTAFITLLIIALYKALIETKQNNDKSFFIMLSFGIIAGLVDFGGYFTNLGVSWLLFWFPLAFLVTHKNHLPYKKDAHEHC